MECFVVDTSLFGTHISKRVRLLPFFFGSQCTLFSRAGPLKSHRMNETGALFTVYIPYKLYVFYHFPLFGHDLRSRGLEHSRIISAVRQVPVRKTFRNPKSENDFVTPLALYGRPNDQ
jgi:hypothetical protein